MEVKGEGAGSISNVVAHGTVIIAESSLAKTPSDIRLYHSCVVIKCLQSVRLERR